MSSHKTINELRDIIKRAAPEHLQELHVWHQRVWDAHLATLTATVDALERLRGDEDFARPAWPTPATAAATDGRRDIADELRQPLQVILAEADNLKSMAISACADTGSAEGREAFLARAADVKESFAAIGRAVGRIDLLGVELHANDQVQRDTAMAAWRASVERAELLKKDNDLLRKMRDEDKDKEWRYCRKCGHQGLVVAGQEPELLPIPQAEDLAHYAADERPTNK